MLVKFYTEDERFIEEGTVEEPFTDKHVGQQVTLDTVWRVVRMLSDGWEPRTGEVFQQVVLRPDEVD